MSAPGARGPITVYNEQQLRGDFIRVNARDTPFDVSRTVLKGSRNLSNSVLGRIFSSIKPGSAADITLDIDPVLFGAILKWVNDGIVERMPTANETRRFYNLAQSLELSSLAAEIEPQGKPWLIPIHVIRSAEEFSLFYSRKCFVCCDLRHVPINKFDFTGCDLSHAILSGIDFSYSSALRGINLSYADLSGCNLTCANLTKSDLSNANLTQVNATNASFFECSLRNADLSEAMVKGARFTNSILQGIILEGVNTEGTIGLVH